MRLWRRVGRDAYAALGILLLVRPGSGILTLLWLIGAFATATGIVGIGWAFRVRTAIGSADQVAEKRS